MEKKRIQVIGLIYIGKEANKIEDQPLDVEKPQVFINEEEIKQKFFALRKKEAREIGINRSELSYLKKKAREGKLNFNSKYVRKIITYYYS